MSAEKWEPCECMLIRMEVNSGPKHLLLYYDYHSNGLLPEFLCKQQARHLFCSIFLTFPIK